MPAIVIISDICEEFKVIQCTAAEKRVGFSSASAAAAAARVKSA